MSSAPPPPRSAYIHVPFCKYRCGYCDFAIVADRDDLVGTYLQALASELSWLGEPREVDTLYFGGGTPSHLDAASLTALCEIAKRWHPLAQGYEWTVEANPESLTADRVAVLCAQGVTRLSLGVQSLDDAKLRALERNHSRHEVVRAMDLARAAGMQVSVDLMFAAPGETLEQWRRDLAAAIELRPDHISAYGLTWEPGAAFTVRRDKGLLRPLDEELERAMYSQAIERLTEAAFEHYEVSNFALAGRRSRHNEVYWAGSEYFAAGPGAARYVDGVRSTNHRSTTTYLKRVQTGMSAIFEQEELTPEQRARELLVLGLRRLEGVQRSTFAIKSGFEMDQLAGKAIGKFVELGLLSDDGSRVKLTREGLFVSDALWPELL